MVLLFFGGDNGARTRDLLTASQALSQLSYTPANNIYYNEKLNNVNRNKNFKKNIDIFTLE